MTEKVFDAYGQYYDLLYADKDYAAEVDYVVTLLKNHGVLEGDLLEFGSGTGRHASLIVNHGYRVHGIEVSPEMISQSKIIPGFTCQQGDIANTKISHKYDAVLSLFHVLSYQSDNNQLQKVFANAATHLNQGGLFIFDFWYSPAVHDQKPEVRVKRMANESVEVIRICEPEIYPNKNCVDVNYTIYVRDLVSSKTQVIKETHHMRHFSLPEVAILAEMYGFQLLASEEFLSGNAPSEKTWGVCVILKKTDYD